MLFPLALMILPPQPESAPAGANLFQPGDLVRHRRYGYRGVVAALDLRCIAPEDWYHSNQTQPKKAQPWYHVLVHGEGHSTYAAESNLAPDEEIAPIVHPLIQHLFKDFRDGRYERNETPWPPDGY